MMSPLKGSTVRRESLTEAQRAQMLALMQLCYAGVSPERFAEDLDGKQYVAILAGVGGWAGAVVSGGLDARDGSAALGFANAMKDLPQRTTKGGMLYVFALP